MCGADGLQTQITSCKSEDQAQCLNLEVNLAMKKQSLHSQQTFTDMGENTEDF